MTSSGTFTNTYKNYCLYREFIDSQTLLIIVYCEKNNKFYQKTLIDKEWETISSNFTIGELEEIFKVCVNNDNDPGYILDIVENNKQLLLQFTCKERIKTYSWNIQLTEKTASDIEKIESIFNVLKSFLCDNEKTNTNSNSECDFVLTDLVNGKYQKDDIINFLANLEKTIKELFFSQKKELLLVPYIAKLNESEINKTVSEKIKYRFANDKKVCPSVLKLDSDETHDDDSESDNEINNGESIDDDDNILSEDKFTKPLTKKIQPQQKVMPKKKSVFNSKDSESESSTASDEVYSDDSDSEQENESTEYDTFIKNRIKELKKEKSGLYQTQYVQMAVNEWNIKNSKNKFPKRY
ncbi:putative orfan [Tupanvirus soda lake]|uniref:Orfan n=2 Tax=Tupanvirus TaxID=2094720 RepID=A0AC62ACY0_9VIRU|nr:putative orfan [Tupanvirus soda lake]QKU35547.1 putative orfan [Tupanvirus soda lake]